MYMCAKGIAFDSVFTIFLEDFRIVRLYGNLFFILFQDENQSVGDGGHSR